MSVSRIHRQTCVQVAWPWRRPPVSPHSCCSLLTPACHSHHTAISNQLINKAFTQRHQYIGIRYVKRTRNSQESKSTPDSRNEYYWNEPRYSSVSNSLFTPPTQTRQDSPSFDEFCLVSTQFPIFKFSLILNIFEAEQMQIGNWVETRQNCLVLSPTVFTPPTRTRQDKTVLSCPCRRCEIGCNISSSFSKPVMSSTVNICRMWCNLGTCRLHI